MSRFKPYLALAALLGAGCAATPEPAADRGSGQSVQPAADAAATQQPDVERTIMLDHSALDTSGIIMCRDGLTRGSNVIVTRCLTAKGWREYERRERIEAQKILRTMQGSAYQ